MNLDYFSIPRLYVKVIYIVTRIDFAPFALSLSKGCSWFGKPVLSLSESKAEGLTTNGT